MSSFIFTSKRLGFRAYKASDQLPFRLLNQDKEVMKYFPFLLSDQASDDFLERINNALLMDGYGFFAVELIETGQFIGFIGLQKTNFESEFTPCIEIGWRIRKEFWNQGYATEGAKACLKYGFKDLNFEEILSFCPEVNLASERIMQKIGMKKQGEFLHPKILDYPDISSCVWYQITAKQFDLNE